MCRTARGGSARFEIAAQRNGKPRDSAIAESSNRQREEKALDARWLLLGDKTVLLKRRESKNCDLETMTRKVADAQGETTDMVTGLHRDMVST